ncbi:MAG TPA: homocysteine S-methyltransferase family protein [Ignavibacteriaceae bacterium]|nr:homocysteine S-methyltransferase family protein [Ignavibacteriaceae bacterium]
MKIDEFNKYDLIISEGSIIERLKREFAYEIDEHILNAIMVYQEEGKFLLKQIYKQYIDIAFKAEIPIIILTPTWKANEANLVRAGFENKNVNKDCFDFVDSIRQEYGTFADKIFIGGLIGVKGDSYNPSEALSIENSFNFHTYQIKNLYDAGVDFIFASTLPSLTEALGIAQAASELSAPYFLSFVIKKSGLLLDDTPLTDAITKIDSAIPNKPYAYFINCVHPGNVIDAFNAPVNNADIIKNRVMGIQANSSILSPEELDNAEELIKDDIDVWAAQMKLLHNEKGLKVLGGCCGTNDKHICKLV